MWSVLPMRPKARMLALISVIPKQLCAVYQHLELPNALSWPAPSRGCTTRTGYFKCREVKTGFYRNKSMQTGSSGTLIGWKSGQTTFVPLWDRMEGAWLRTQVRQHGLPLLHGKNQTYWANILQLNWSGPNQGKHSSLCLYPLSSNTGVLYTATSAAHRTHDIQGEYSKGRSQIFLAVILFGSCPPRNHSWYSHNGSPFHSLLLI